MDVLLIVFLILLGVGIILLATSSMMPGIDLRKHSYYDDDMIAPAHLGDITIAIGWKLIVVSAVLVIGRLLWIRLFP